MSDQAARDRAAHGYDENLVVVAGAGSGKTSLLVERVVCQIVERELAHDAFAAITFTEKAAAEMRHRLEAALVALAAHAQADTPPAALESKREADRAFAWLRERVSLERIAERARAAVHALADMEVTTIHGFCARLLRRYPIESGVGPEFQVDTGDRIDELVDELWERFLAGPEGVGGARRERFQGVLEQLGLGELESLARAAAAFTVREAVLAAPLPDMQRVFGAWARESLGRIEELVKPPAAPGPESWLAAARAPLEALVGSGEAAFREALANASYSRVNGICGLLEGNTPTSASARTAEALAKEIRPRLERLREVDDALLGEALALLRPFALQVQAEAKRSGLLPFDALLSLARDLLLTHRRVRDEVAARCRVLFLDEFQDTDPLQYEIVFLVAAGESAPLPAGSLFVVGDPKQAIYRFRGADISAYEEAVRRILSQRGERLVLTANFRSRPEVLEPLDELFRRSFEPPAEADRSARNAYVTYDGLEARRERAGAPCVERWSIGKAANANESRRVEAAVIAGWIVSETAAGRLRPGQVALLMRALTDAHVWVRALQDRGLSVWVGRPDEPDREPALQQVTALLRALANPSDAPAVVGFLRSPLGGVPDAELATHAGRNQGAWLYTAARTDPESVPNLARAFAWLREWHARVRTEPVDRVLVALRDETPLLGLHAAARDGWRRVTDLSALLDRLTARAAAAPDRDLVRLVTALEREEQRRASEEPVPESDAVRVLSIHAAKGLEFDVVVLPDLTRGTMPERGDRQGVMLASSRERGVLAISTRAARSSSWVEREAVERVHADAELRRLLYVAATRARERLVFAEAQRRDRGRPGGFGALIAGWKSPAVVEREILEPDTSAATPQAPPAPDVLAALERTRAAAQRASAAAVPPLARPSGLAEDDDLVPGERDDSLPSRVVSAQKLAQAVGTALHEVLERWSFRDAQHARSLLRGAVTRAARLAGLAEPEVAREAGALLESLLASDLPRRLREVDVLGRELPLLLRDDAGRTWAGTLDLLYRDPQDGLLVVADYKTDRSPDAAARTRYRAQLEVYARGVARLFPSEPPPRLELVWLRTGQRERLSLESPA